jgi:hypothetical protein
LSRFKVEKISPSIFIDENLHSSKQFLPLLQSRVLIQMLCQLPELVRYAPRYRSEGLAKIGEAGVRRGAEIYYQQLDALRSLREQVRRDLLAEGREHSAMKLLRQIPSIGPYGPFCSLL